MGKKQSRTLLERAEAIFSFLDQQVVTYETEGIPKSSFQEVGISPKDIDQWLELIQFIQAQPRIKVERIGHRTNVDLIENEFMMYLKQKFLDRDADYVERNSAIMMYLKVLINLERSKGAEIDWKSLIDDPWEISRPTIIKLAKEGRSELGQENTESP